MGGPFLAVHLPIDTGVPCPSYKQQSGTVDAFSTFRFLPAGEAHFAVLTNGVILS
jgi:hypothetical protein